MPNFEQDKEGYICEYQYPDPAVKQITWEGQGEKPPFRATTAWYVFYDEDTNLENGYVEYFDIEARAPKLLLESGKVPFRYLGLRLNRIRAQWLASRTARVELEYGLPAYKYGEDGWSREFNVTSRSIHVDRSRWGHHPGFIVGGLQDNSAYFGDLIGISDDGVAGCDIDESIGNYTMTTSFAPDHPLAINTINIRQRIAQYLDCINNEPFEGFAQLELRLGPGTSVRRDDEGTTTVTLNFMFSKNEAVNIPIYMQDNNGNTIQATKFFYKGGWDYIWTFTKEVQQDLGGIRMKIHQPFGAQVNYMYRDADFNRLIADLS